MQGLLTILSILCGLHCCCQELSYKQFTVKDGLPGAIVYHSVQDNNGFIWFATNQGVSRFDGRTFRNFTKEDGLPDNDILKLYVDRHNNVWFISLLGIPSVFHNNTIIRFDSCASVRNICEDAFTDSIVLMTLSYPTGLCGYYKSINKPGQWHFVPHFHSVEDIVDFPVLRASSSGKLNAYFSYKGLHSEVVTLQNSSTKKQYSFLHDIAGNSLAFIWRQLFSLSRDGHGLFFIGSELLYYSDFQRVRLLLNLRELGLNENEKDEVNMLFSENDSTLWICSRSRGLQCIRNPLSPHRTVSAYFPESFCTSIMKDREGGYWITTHSEGVYYLPNLSFHSVSLFPGREIRSARCIHALDGDHVAAGFSDGNIMLIHSSSLKSRIFPQWASGNKNNRVLDIKPWKDQTMIISTDAGLYYVSSTGDSKPLLLHRAAKECYVASDSVIVIAMATGTIIATSQGRVKKEGAVDRAICVAGFKEDSFYWGGLHGMYLDKGDTTINLGKQIAALSGIINHIDIAPDTALWVSTGQGLVILREGKVSQLSKDQGLPSNLCKHVSFDGSTAWVSTDKGISRIDYRWDHSRLTWSLSNITEEDGLAANDVNQTTPLGQYIWAATASGISFFSKDYVSHSVWRPLINITRIVAENSSLPPADTLSLRPAIKRLLVELSGISFRSGKEISYDYRLKGLDNSWRRITSNSIEFSALPFGNYTLEVRAIDRWGQTSGQSQTLFIHHPPPFWMSTWFVLLSYLLMALAAGTGVYIFHRHRRHKREMDYQVKKKMHDLELMALRSQMNPHFIFNCLTSIQYHIIQSDIKNAEIYLHKFSTLIRQTLQNSTAHMILLRDEIKLLRLYLDLEKLRLGERMDFQIYLSRELEQDDWLIPSMIVQPYVENAIKHGISPLKDVRGMLGIHFNLSGNCIECIIDDNGPGIDSHSRQNLDPEDGYRSMGTSITQKRIDTINALQKENIRVSISDKRKHGLSDNGTLVKLYFPITTYYHDN